MKIFINWVIYAAAIMVTAYVLPGVMVEGIVAALVLAVVLGAINVFIKPVVVILTLPFNILTVGLFTFVINALLIMLAAMIVPGFGVASFWWAMLFAVVLAVITWTFSKFGGEQGN